MVLDDMRVDIPCPLCKHQFKVTLGQIQRGETVVCPKCHKSIKLKPEGDDLRKIEKSIKDLKDSIKDINIKFKI
ncbi:hypothetical protein ES706_04287 [subsurface metagenome]